MGVTMGLGIDRRNIDILIGQQGGNVPQQAMPVIRLDLDIHWIGPGLTTPIHFNKSLGMFSNRV